MLENAWRLHDGLAALGFAVIPPQELPAEPACRCTPRASAPTAPGSARIVTPIIPVLVGDDWKAALLWRALYDAGVFVNTALHPAVPPGGALLRTSVMATHDDATLDRALEIFARGQARVRGRARTAARPRTRPEPPAPTVAEACGVRRLVHFFTSLRPTKKPASSDEPDAAC